jgi:hypothetical protein
MYINKKLIYEKITRFCFSKKNNFLLWIGLSLLPLISIFTLSVYRLSNANELENWLLDIKGKQNQTLQKRNAKKQFLNIHTCSDQDFFSKIIEKKTFLQKEINFLNSLQKNPSYQFNPKTSQRLQRLTSTNNKLQFIEEHITSNNQFKESKKNQKTNIELNNQDLNDLLFLIERNDPQIKKKHPQLIIMDLHLTKTKGYLNNEHFILSDLNILNREFISR